MRSEFDSIGLTTVPASNEEESLFFSIHRKLLECFGSIGLPVHVQYGAEATPDEALKVASRVGCHHLLAHGKFEVDNDAMKSSILLSDGKTLPSKDRFGKGETGAGPVLTAAEFMLNGTSACHVTLQACSLHRTSLTPRGEIWGVMRALLAGGAESVIGPLWGIDLLSSATLLAAFYQEWLLGHCSKSVALARAQRQLASSNRNPEWQHFYHWGAFQYLGQ
jgi:CHAT domain-containing protein